MTEVKPEYNIRKLAKNGKLRKDFPVKIVDNEQFLKFVVNYIKFPLQHGINQIIIHAKDGLILQTEEKKMNK